MIDIFEQARSCIGPNLVTSFFSSPGANTSGREYFTLAPHRNDRNIGSFCINLDTGYWTDNATGENGDMFDLLCLSKNMNKKQAAEFIVKESGGILETKAPIKKPKPKPIIPIPKTENDLKSYASAKWAQDRWGQFISIYNYKNELGEWVFSTAKYLTDSGKNLIPFYYTVENKWKAATPDIKLPLFGSENLKESDKVLIVEGEKCAGVEIPGWIVVTWCGGSNKTSRSDWSVLKNKIVTIWPDNDEPGLIAAKKIKEYLPHSRILKIKNRPDKWDIYDAKQEGLDLKDFVENSDYDGQVPFDFLGYDEKRYFVMPKNQNIPLAIPRGDSSIKNMLREIAPTDYWFDNFYKEDEEGRRVVNTEKAINWFREKNISKGMFNNDDILGLGPHIDNGRIIINTGKDLILHGNGRISYEDYQGKKTFCRSKLSLKIIDKPWNIHDGNNFVKQLMTFSFERKIDYISIAGYAALSSFASILKHRPHIWITGKRGIGKSTLLFDLLQPVLGNLCLFVEGLTTEAAFRQSTVRDCRPIIVDEFEAHNRFELQTLKNVLKLARSAYSGTEIVKGSSDHKAVHFKTKMMFCFASINVNIDNSADKSRISVCRLVPGDGRMSEVKNPEGLKKRILDKLHILNPMIQEAKEFIISKGYDDRTGDTYAPFLAGFWLIVSDKKFMQDEKYSKFVEDALKNIFNSGKEHEDSDRVVGRILQESIRIDPETERTISEMLTEKNDITGSLRYDDRLRRLGLRRCRVQNKDVLAVSINSPQISKILKDTPFEDYKEVLQRNDAVIIKSHPLRMAGKKERCIIFDWEKLYMTHIEHPEDSECPF